MEKILRAKGRVKEAGAIKAEIDGIRKQVVPKAEVTRLAAATGASEHTCERQLKYIYYKYPDEDKYALALEHIKGRQSGETPGIDPYAASSRLHVGPRAGGGSRKRKSKKRRRNKTKRAKNSKSKKRRRSKTKRRRR